MSTQPECPECDKLSAVAEESQKIGEFLEWLHYTKELLICDRDDAGTYYRYIISPEELLAEYFEIDLQKVEQEKQALLQWLREE